MQIDQFTYSTFSAVSELIVTAIVLWVIFDNFRGNRLRAGWLFGTLAFELLVNVSYMVKQTFVVFENRTAETPAYIELVGAFHGILSLGMFVALIVVAVLAYRASKRGVAYFQGRPALTGVFVVLWMLSILSGEWLYYEIHLKYLLG